MAVYTDVSDEDLAAFLADYDLGEMLSLKGIAEGVENSNFLLHTQKATSLLTLYEKRVNSAELPFFLGLMRHLAARGLNCPQPVSNRHGEALGHLSGKPAAIVTFLEGMWPRRPNTGHCAAVGGALAQMHRAGADFALTRANALAIDAWRPLYNTLARRADSIQPGMAALLAQELDYLEQNWPRDLPLGIIHADAFPDNVFFIGKNVSGLIDFYFACNDMLAYDLAICLNAWCFESDMSYNITKGQALVDGYSNARALSAAEIAALPVLARGAAMRFLLTRLADWLDVPEGALVRPKNPLEYFRKLRFHQQVQSVRDYGVDV